MKKLLIPIILVLIAVALAVYFFIIKKKNDANNLLMQKDSPPPAPVTATESNLFPLKKGSKNNLVTNVQKFLNWKFKADLTVDGDFGPKTETAVIKFLKVKTISQGLYKEGILASYGQ